jgi:hypothetical protein
MGLGCPARGTEPARAAVRGRGGGGLDEGDALAARNHELRDALAAGDGERAVAQVDEQHLHLAAVVAIYVKESVKPLCIWDSVDPRSFLGEATISTGMRRCMRHLMRIDGEASSQGRLARSR